jgi:hypothetical protein
MPKAVKNKQQITPFSNGTSAMIWYENNCQSCTKAYFPKNGEYPSDETMKNYVSIGKECKCKYYMDWAFVSSEIPLEIAEKMGYTEEKGFPRTCILFSDNDDDRYKAPKRPKPDSTPPNQLLMPFYLQELGIKEIKLNRINTKQRSVANVDASSNQAD